MPSFNDAPTGHGEAVDAMKSFEHLFENLPYPYQERVYGTLLSGQNVILRAPTGAGKTEAALSPFLLARQRGDTTFPRRCILASPMRTLAKDLHQRATVCAQKVRLPKGELPLTVLLHTGEDPAAPLLEGDIIVTTVDQLLSNYLHVPYSVGARSGNIGAGGVVASYVVLDEFHLFDPQRAFRTTVEMARTLQGVTPFLFMTATYSRALTQRLAVAVDAVTIEPTAEELGVMHSQQKRRHIQRVDAELTAQAVASAHQRRSIAIANTVDRVQTLYAELQRLQAGTDLRAGEQPLHDNLRGVTLAMLHSRFFPAHRNQHEQHLATLLGRGSTANVILVASQAVEVGLNISSEHLHTEVCPGNSLLQRAGRNARFYKEEGTVSVYRLPANELGQWNVLPYKGQEGVIQATWDALEGLPGPVTPAAEAALIDTVHTPGDKQQWQEYESTRKTTHRDSMHRAFQGDRSMRPTLIRDIQNVSLLLLDQATELHTWDEINRFERLSVRGVDFVTLERNREELGLDYDHDVNWLAKIPREREPDRRGSGEDSRTVTVLDWVPVTSAAQLRHETLVLVNPAFVFYTPQVGFRWTAPEGAGPGVSRDDLPDPHPRRPSGERPDYWYTYETYQEHIENVLRASERVAADVWRLCPKVDQKFALPPGAAELALKAAIAGHDIGKLSVGWQHWSRTWQVRQVATYPGHLWNGTEGTHQARPQGQGEYSAHTDSHPKFDKGADKTMPKRPSHAGESAALLIPAIDAHFMDTLGEDKGLSIIRAISGAICRHHGAGASGQADAWALDAGAGREAARVFLELAGIPLDVTWIAASQKHGVDAVTDPDLPTPDDELGWLVYTLASRALRLGDTNSFDRQGDPT
jgi:CRISPR-associated endonuclease/helicase Cas3